MIGDVEQVIAPSAEAVAHALLVAASDPSATKDRLTAITDATAAHDTAREVAEKLIAEAKAEAAEAERLMVEAKRRDDESQAWAERRTREVRQSDQDVRENEASVLARESAVAAKEKALADREANHARLLEHAKSWLAGVETKR